MNRTPSNLRTTQWLGCICATFGHEHVLQIDQLTDGIRQCAVEGVLREAEPPAGYLRLVATVTAPSTQPRPLNGMNRLEPCAYVFYLRQPCQLPNSTRDRSTQPVRAHINMSAPQYIDVDPPQLLELKRSTKAASTNSNSSSIRTTMVVLSLHLSSCRLEPGENITYTSKRRSPNVLGIVPSRLLPASVSHLPGYSHADSHGDRRQDLHNAPSTVTLPPCTAMRPRRVTNERN